MRSFVLLFWCVLVLQLHPLAAQEPTSQQLRFGERVHDFGTIPEQGGVVSFDFRFVNEGPGPVVLTDVVTSCKCIRAEFSRKPVLPGASAVIRVSYDPFYRPGSFSREVNILYNDRTGHQRVWIKGEVTPFNHPIEEDHPYDLGGGLHANLKVLLMGGIRQGESKTLLFRYANGLEKEMHVRFRVEGGTRAALVMPDTLTLKPDERGTMRLVYTMPASALGLRRLTVTPVVNGRAQQPLELTAVGLPPRSEAGEKSPVAVCSQTNFLAERRNTEQRFTLTITNKGGSPLRILAVDPPQSVVTTLRRGSEIAPGETGSFTVTLQASAGAAEGFHDRIYVVTNDPRRPQLTFNINTKN